MSGLSREEFERGLAELRESSPDPSRVRAGDPMRRDPVSRFLWCLRRADVTYCLATPDARKNPQRWAVAGCLANTDHPTMSICLWSDGGVSFRCARGCRDQQLRPAVRAFEARWLPATATPRVSAPTLRLVPGGSRARAIPAALDPLKQVPLGEYLPAVTGVELNGANKAHCPLPDHEDRTPSFGVIPTDPTRWHCFGCGRGGGVVDLAAAVWGVEPRGSAYLELRQQIAKRLLVARVPA